MTCPKYGGTIELAGWYILCDRCDKNTIGIHCEFKEEKEEHRGTYCLGNYPECPYYKSKEENNERK